LPLSSIYLQLPAKSCFFVRPIHTPVFFVSGANPLCSSPVLFSPPISRGYMAVFSPDFFLAGQTSLKKMCVRIFPQTVRPCVLSQTTPSTGVKGFPQRGHINGAKFSPALIPKAALPPKKRNSGFYIGGLLEPPGGLEGKTKGIVSPKWFSPNSGNPGNLGLLL